ncbi:hypothetical protein U1E44_07435 [Arenibacter sp. GZD96]|uniref:hypothetical protein n=1 Tax=Aurantibrevibacter litoralis TaxID=3106030 RepID=UPI002AFF3168|nr:hypothetical protein [Arenibacter sp. GZD-96]MEA1785919.1 hypothetical protein [Arenibacter sp. GZD-96]
MSEIEKKEALKEIIDKLSDNALDQAILYMEDLAIKDKKRILYVKNLLEREKQLFARLAE